MTSIPKITGNCYLKIQLSLWCSLFHTETKNRGEKKVLKETELLKPIIRNTLLSQLNTLHQSNLGLRIGTNPNNDSHQESLHSDTWLTGGRTRQSWQDENQAALKPDEEFLDVGVQWSWPWTWLLLKVTHPLQILWSWACFLLSKNYFLYSQIMNETQAIIWCFKNVMYVKCQDLAWHWQVSPATASAS